MNKNCKLTLSIIMPALNEEDNIGEAVKTAFQSLKKREIDGEVIVVDDGSSDNTHSIVVEMMKKYDHLKMITHQRPMGLGYSFFDGIKNSDKDIVVLLPGDNEVDPDYTLSYFALLNQVDIIVPFFYNVEVRDRVRRLISSTYRFIINMSFGINLNYTNGTVFYRRCILQDIELKSTGFFYQAELLIKLIRKGYLFAEVPNFLLTRMGGTSKATTLKSLWRVIRDYLSLVYQIHIRRIENKKDYNRLNPKSVTYLEVNNR
jgi:dolichol-phosphate mannosyltransferase